MAGCGPNARSGLNGEQLVVAPVDCPARTPHASLPKPCDEGQSTNVVPMCHISSDSYLASINVLVPMVYKQSNNIALVSATPG